MDRDLITKYEGDCVPPHASYNFDNCMISGGNLYIVYISCNNQFNMGNLNYSMN
jgi:hypothetical protein